MAQIGRFVKWSEIFPRAEESPTFLEMLMYGLAGAAVGLAGYLLR